MIEIKPESFPAFKSGMSGQWAPIILQPLVGAYEQMVIGVLAFHENKYHLECANSLTKLQCLYGENAESLIFIIESCLAEIQEEIEGHEVKAALQSLSSFSNVRIGEISTGEGEDLANIAQSWMSNISSLYSLSSGDLESRQDNVISMAAATAVDRLPTLIMEYVIGHQPSYRNFFSQDILENKIRRSRKDAHSVIIDFSGAKVAANFSTLQISQKTASVDKIKRKMWDLKIDRDRTRDGMLYREHQMIIQCPDKNDPQFSTKQIDAMSEALQDLEKQADMEEIRFLPLNSVNDIGEHLLKKEAA